MGREVGGGGESTALFCEASLCMIVALLTESMLCACSNVNNTVDRCEAQQEATLERDKQSLKRVRE